MTTDKDELAFLAAGTRGEASPLNVFEEMAAIANVLVRQRDKRGYETMQAFMKAEPTYAYAYKDKGEGFMEVMNTNEADANARRDKTKGELADTEKQIADLKATLGDAHPDKATAAKLKKLEGHIRGLKYKLKGEEGVAMAFAAAKNALEGGKDYSNGAFFWDGNDIRTRYAHHPKVLEGIKIMDEAHNVVRIKDSIKIKIKYKNVEITQKGSNKKVKVKEEVARIDHVFESTAGYGNTIFWKFNPDYVKNFHASEYK